MKTLDFQSFNAFFNDYGKRFVRFACSYVRDEAAAEDLVMESMMVYWTKKDTLSSATNPPSFVLTVLKNKCIDYLRHQAVMQNASSEISSLNVWETDMRIKTLEAFDPDVIFTDEINRIVKETLDHLPEQTRRIFLMSRYQNMKYRDIASDCNMTEKGVEFHISKAISALKIALKDYLPASILLLLLQ